jgi:hypothetical protein
MPLDHSCRLDQHHGMQGLRPNPVKPHPEEPVRAEKPRTAGMLASQDRQLVPQGDELQFQRGAATKAERKQGNQSGKNGDHADDAMVAAR